MYLKEKVEFKIYMSNKNLCSLFEVIFPCEKQIVKVKKIYFFDISF